MASSPWPRENGGNFYFIAGAAQIPGILTGELGEALAVTVRNASLVITSNGDEQVVALNDFPSSSRPPA